MIEQTSAALNTQVQNERVFRSNEAAPASRQQQPPAEQDTTSGQGTTDTVSLSAEAVALSRNVEPPSAAPEAQEAPAQETPTASAGEPQRLGRIDIQA